MCNGITIGGDVSIQISGPCVPPDGSVTAAKIGSGNAGDGQVLTADGNGGAAWEAPAGGGPGYLKYVALLAQSGTNDPVATVLENTIGAIVWSRDSTGSYRATLANGFLWSTTWVSATLGYNDNPVAIFWSCENNNVVSITVFNGPPVSADPVDDWTASIEIRVYP